MTTPTNSHKAWTDQGGHVSIRVVRTAPGLIQSLSQASLPGLSAWVEVGGIAPSLCLKASPPQPIST